MKLLNKFFWGALLFSPLITMASQVNKEIDIHIGPGVSQLDFDQIASFSGDGSSENGIVSSEFSGDVLRIIYSTDMEPGFYTGYQFLAMYQYDWLLGMSDAASEHDAEYLPDVLDFYIQGVLSINGKKQASKLPGTTFAFGPYGSDSADMWWVGSSAANYQIPESLGVPYVRINKLYNDGGAAPGGSMDDWLPIFTEDGDQYCIHRYYTGWSGKTNDYQIQRCGDYHELYLKPRDHNITSIDFTSDGDVVVPKSSSSGSAPYYPGLIDSTYDPDTGYYHIGVTAYAYDATDLIDQNAQSNLAWTVLGDDPDTKYLSFYINGKFTINGNLVDHKAYIAYKASTASWDVGVDSALFDSGDIVVDATNLNLYHLGSGGDVQSGGVEDLGVSDSTISGTLEQNSGKIYAGSGVYDLSYTLKGVNVTDGQAHQSYLNKNTYHNGYLEIEFDSARKASSAIADAYKSAAGNETYESWHSGHTPGTLNWYVYGQMLINGSPVVSDVYLAQGSDNAWWFGSNGMWRQKDSEYMWVKTADGNQYCVSQGDDKYSSFMVSDKCPDYATAAHMDSLHLHYGNGVYSLSFQMENGADDVAGGQPHADFIAKNEIDYNGDGQAYLNLQFNAGHNESASVADRFKDGDIHSINTLESANGDTGPKDMFFYFNGKLTINGSPVVGDIKLAEESIKFSYTNTSGGYITPGSCKVNAWWVGGTGDAVHDDGVNYVLQVYTQNHQCYMFVPDDINNSSDCTDATHSGHNYRFTVKGCYL